MFAIRMAIVPTLHVLFCLITLAHAVCASQPHLSRQLSNFIPSCAEECFLSFLSVNYKGSGCGALPSLKCLCSAVGNTPFTLGEGAVQCLAAEKRVGSCSESEVSERVIDIAYFMCNGQPNAIKPSHVVITASLDLPTSKGEPVKFRPLPTTTKGTEIPTSLPTTLVTATGSPPLPPDPPGTTSSAPPTTKHTSPSPSTFELSTTSKTDTGIVPPPPAETEAGSNRNDDDSPPSLSTGQVAGIAIGVAAAAAVAIGTIILARYCRRRKHPNIKAAFLPRRRTWGYHPSDSDTNSSRSIDRPRRWRRKKGKGQNDESRDDETLNDDVHNITNLPPPPAHTRSSYNRLSWRPDIIGLALSAEQQKREATSSPPSRRMSKLLPEKPVMAPPTMSKVSPQRQGPAQEAQQHEQSRRNDSPPRLPPITGLSNQQSSTQSKPQPPVPLKLDIPQGNNATAATRPRDSNLTEFEEDGGSSLSPEGQIWRPPSTALFSAAPYYVADKNGNWVLGGSQGSANAVDSQAGGPPCSEPKSAPASGSMYPAAYPPMPRPGPGPSRATSQGKLSWRTSLAPPANITRGQAPYPTSSIYSQGSSASRPLFYAGTTNPSESTAPTPSTSGAAADNRDSSRNSSITLFESSSDESKEPTPPEVPGSLSPVVESPHSACGRSHVAYPKIPGRSRNSTASRPDQSFAPPPRRPLVYYPPGQPSPTLGRMHHQEPTGPGMSSYNVPIKGRQHMENPGLARTGSPPTMRVVEPSPEPDDRGQLPSARVRSRPPSFNPPCQPRGQPSHQRQRPPQQQHRPQPPPSSFNQPYPSVPPSPYRRYSQIPAPLNPSTRPKPQRFPHHPPLSQQAPCLNTDNIPPQTNYASPISDASTSSSLLAKRLGTDRAAQMTLPTDHHQPSAHPKWHREGPPSTPRQSQEPSPATGWKPRLTPTRRGDELLIDVQ